MFVLLSYTVRKVKKEENGIFPGLPEIPGIPTLFKNEEEKPVEIPTYYLKDDKLHLHRHTNARKVVAVDDLAENGFFCGPCKSLVSWLKQQGSDFSVNGIMNLINNKCDASWCTFVKMFITEDLVRQISDALLNHWSDETICKALSLC